MKYPTERGIAIPVWELDLPESKYGDKGKYQNNHHAHFSRRKFERTAVTLALRDLERHQYMMPVDVHKILHDTYEPPEFPTEEQAALEVIDAYEKGEQFKVYNRQCHWYDRKEIPPELIDGFIATYGLRRVFALAGD